MYDFKLHVSHLLGVRRFGPPPAALSADPVAAFVARDPVNPSREEGRVVQPAYFTTDDEPRLL